MKTCLQNCKPGDIICYNNNSPYTRPFQYRVREPMNEYGGVLTECLSTAGETMFVQPHLDSGFIKKIIKLCAINETI